MSDFLHTQQIFSVFDSMVRRSNGFIKIVSPYINLDGEQSMLLRKAAERGIPITIIYRLDSMDTANQLEALSDLPGIKIIGCPELHAKIYATEEVAIMTSKNLTTRKSDCCSIEIGILFENGDDFYDDLLESVDDLEKIQRSKILVDNSAELEQFNTQSGYCIHCGKPINLNAEHPYCYNCFKELNSPDPETKEKYCHFCGKEAEGITFRYPVERDCYSNYLSAYSKARGYSNWIR